MGQGFSHYSYARGPGLWRCGIKAKLETAKAEVIALLLRMTEKNGHSIALIFPDESADFIRGYTAGQIDAFRLALEHVRDG